MELKDYINALGRMKSTNERIKKQLHCLQALQFKYTEEKFQVGVEYRLTFDIPQLLEEYSWKAQKCQYFLEKYINGIAMELKIHMETLQKWPEDDHLLAGKTFHLDYAAYNFDAFVLAASALMEGESIDFMASHLKKSPVASYYPRKNEVGLYWQLNLIRNRIVHHTGIRYDNGEICQCYFDFSSRINGIRLKNKQIELQCTQIDVYRSPEVQKEIIRILLTGDETNVFNCLFPDTAGKGHGKKNPGILYPGTVLYFDHASSGVRFVTEIQQFVLNMNEAFFVEFAHKIKKKEMIPEICMVYCEDGKEIECRARDLFDMNKIPAKK